MTDPQLPEIDSKEITPEEIIKQSFEAGNKLSMDWRFGVTASTSECEQIGAMYLQLHFRIGKQDIFLELTIPQFYDFLHELEKARVALQDTSA